MKNNDIIDLIKNFNIYEDVDKTIYNNIMLKITLDDIFFYSENFINYDNEISLLVQYLILDKLEKQNIEFSGKIYSANADSIYNVLEYIDIKLLSFNLHDDKIVIEISDNDKFVLIKILEIFKWYCERDNDFLIFKPKFEIYEYVKNNK